MNLKAHRPSPFVPLNEQRANTHEPWISQGIADTPESYLRTSALSAVCPRTAMPE